MTCADPPAAACSLSSPQDGDGDGALSEQEFVAALLPPHLLVKAAAAATAAQDAPGAPLAPPSPGIPASDATAAAGGSCLVTPGDAVGGRLGSLVTRPSDSGSAGSDASMGMSCLLYVMTSI